MFVREVSYSITIPRFELAKVSCQHIQKDSLAEVFLVTLFLFCLLFCQFLADHLLGGVHAVLVVQRFATSLPSFDV